MPHFDKQNTLAAMNGRWLDFYQQFTSLKRVAGAWRGPCPLHGGDGPNFDVNPDTGDFYCHSSCQEGGDIFSLLQRLHNITFPEALAEVAEWAGVSGDHPNQRTPTRGLAHTNVPRLDRRIVPDAPLVERGVARAAHERLLASPKRLAWLRDHRGLTQETLERFQIGLDQHSEDQEAGVWRVTFPVEDEQGRLTNLRRHLFSYKADLTDERRRELGKTLPWDKGLRADLFPLPAIRDTKTVLLVEGEADALLANQQGFPAVTGTSGAGTWKSWWTEALGALGIEQVVTLYDGDEAGNKGRLKPAAALNAAGIEVRMAHYPSGVKDLTEWVIQHGAGPADLKRIIDESTLYVQDKQVGAALLVHDVSPAPVVSVPAMRDEWPVLDECAYHGLAGDIVRTIEPHTEADPIALLAQFLVAFGSAVGRSAHFTAEADRHYGNLFAVIVGVSSKGRKGSSLGQVRRLFQSADPEWENYHIQSGLSSGEGLIHSVRDPVEKQERHKVTKEMETVVVDEGVADKRLLVTESEFASVLRQTQRDGNTLSATLRNAWDGTVLQSMTKSSPARATDAHVSIIGHITRDELRKDLAETETANGFGNRFLWVCARRSKELPEGGQIDTVNLAPLVARLREATEYGRGQGKFERDATAREVWHAVYHDLSTGKPGLLGAMTGRSEAQVMRLALLYALLDKATVIRAEHLTAALALWEYCEASARYIFGDSLGDRVADDMLRALRGAKDGMTRSELSNMFGRNLASSRLSQALALLQENGLVRSAQRKTGGAPAEVWSAI